MFEKEERKRQKKGTPRRATYQKGFLNDEMHTTVHITIHHPVPLNLQVQARKSQINLCECPHEGYDPVLKQRCNEKCKHTEPSSAEIKTLSSNGWH